MPLSRPTIIVSIEVKKGLERTIEILDSFGIAHTGTFVDTVSRMNDSPLILEKNGFKLALLNYTYGTNGIAIPKSSIVNLLDTALMREGYCQSQGSQTGCYYCLHTLGH